MQRHVWMALGLVAGILLGLAAATTQNPALLAVAQGLRPVGALFMNLLSMVVIPLVVAAVFTGIAGLGNIGKVGRLGVRTLAFFWVTTLVAIVIGLISAKLILPLAGIDQTAQASLRAAAVVDSGTVKHAVEQMPSGIRFVVDLVPANPLRAAVDGALLPLVVAVTLFAVAATTIPEDKRRTLLDVAEGVTQTLIRVVHWVLVLAPLGICALVAPAVAQFGWSLVRAMGAFLLSVILGMCVFIAGVLLTAVAAATPLRVPRFLRAASDSMLMGFSTTSSLASLPTMLTAAEDLKISRGVAGFVLPLGASINRSGSALFQIVAVLFAAQLYGVSFGATQVVQAMVAVFLASLTVASIPAASVVSLAPAFAATGIPLAGLGILIGLDRIPDMFRTMANVTGHLSGAAVIATGEGDRLS